MSDKPTVVWVEIPVTDLEKARDFYTKVFGFKMVAQQDGPNPMYNFSDTQTTVSGHLYPGTPASDGNGPTVHLALPDGLEAGMERFAAAGGKVLSPPVSIPPGRFAYGTDPDGNSIGLFEPAF